jgi:radical SAM protein with 4Fe4S-binding SPASM domain
MGLSYKIGLAKLPYPPYSITIEATNRCNYRCTFCPQSDPLHMRKRPQGDLTVDGFIEFIKQVKKLNSGNDKISICLDGEPLLNVDFPEFIKIANEENITPRFSTNGRFLSRELINTLIDIGKFIVSIDFASRRDYFEGVRGNPGDFDIILDNILYLMERAKKYEKIAIEVVDISTYSGAKTQESINDMKSLLDIENSTRNIKVFPRQFHNFCGHLDTTNDSKNTKYNICPYPWYQFAVAWNGDVVICCRDTSGRTVLGNIFSKTISEIWNGEPYQNARKLIIKGQISNLKTCINCDLPFRKDKHRWNPTYLFSKITNQ